MKHEVIKIIVAVAVIITAAVVPPMVGNSQKTDTTKVPIDSALYNIYKADSLAIETAKFAFAVDSVKRNLNGLSEDVYANRTQTWQVRYWARRIINRKPKHTVKTVPVLVPVPTSITKESKEIIVRKFESPKYGGDTFRTNMWKAPGEDGLIKQIFKKKK